MQKNTRRRPAVILSIRIALSPGNPEALNILSPRPALILSTCAHIALNPQKNDTINWTFDRFGFWSSDDFKQSQLCGETFPKQSVTCKWYLNENNIHGNRRHDFLDFWRWVEGTDFSSIDGFPSAFTNSVSKSAQGPSKEFNTTPTPRCVTYSCTCTKQHTK